MPAVGHAAFPGKNGRIVYAVEESSGGDLSDDWAETVRPDGSGTRRIDLSMDSPAFSPRGRRIAFGDKFDGGLFATSPRGTRLRRLTHAQDFDTSADWSPSGRRLAFTRSYPEGTATDLWIHYARGERLLVREAGDPAWSVTGDLAFTRSSQFASVPGIWVVRPDGSELRRISPRGFTPDWSPNGKRIVFRTGSDIATMRADGSGFRRLTRGQAFDSDPAFSPDGKRIVFVRDNGTVTTMTSTGRRLMRVARPRPTANFDNDITVSGPDWQPRPLE
jgi:Tol biopolymer transport system component